MQNRFSFKKVAFMAAFISVVGLAGCSYKKHADSDDEGSAPNAIDQMAQQTGKRFKQDSDEQRVSDAIEATFGMKPDVVEEVAPGLKKVYVGGNVVYSTEDGRYLVQGGVFDTLTRKDITQDDMAKASEFLRKPRAKIIADEVDLKDSITYKAIGKEKEELFIFTDSTCPYCVKTHEEIKGYNQAGYTVHYFPWPRNGSRGEGYPLMQTVWCSADKKKALDAEFNKKDVKPIRCDSKIVDKYIAIGNRLKISGTPAIFTRDGRSPGGYFPASDIEEAMQKAR